jgi:hypothetical protein
MNGRSFRSVFMVASCAGAALGCYLVSLRVASERAALESIETRIVLAQSDIRLLQTEIGTRGRLAQLERWNAKVLALSAPSADQFLGGSFELARLTQPQHKVDFQAPVVLASAPAPDRAAPLGEPPADASGRAAALPETTPANLIHDASLRTQTREVPAKPAATAPQAAGNKPADRPVTAAKPATTRSAGKPDLAAAKPVRKKSVDKPSAPAPEPVTKSPRIAKIDPLAPLGDKPPRRPVKDTGTAQ